MNIDKVLIIDFGSQVTKLIARRVRELGVYSEILNINHLKNIKNLESVKGIILSGGPASVPQKKYPKISKEIFLKKIILTKQLVFLKKKIFKKLNLSLNKI